MPVERECGHNGNKEEGTGKKASRQEDANKETRR